MKLFGGGGGHKGESRQEAVSANVAAQPAIKQSVAPKTNPTVVKFNTNNTNGEKKAPKSAGSSNKAEKRKKGKKIFLITVVVLTLVIVGSAAAAAWFLVKPPEPKNDPTIKNPENGDKVDMNNSMLNQGTRIDDVFTFVVGAVDEDQTRTDALMVASMDTKQKAINVMNIPRDTMCNNGQAEAWRKINAAYGMKKGIEQTKIEIERILGFKPDKYVIVNFDGIAAVVDAIGGIEYEVPFRMEYDDPSQNLHIDLYAGNQTLDGKKTVDFLRWRHNNDYSMQYANGDEGRVENQQKFLKSVAKQVLKLENVSKIKEITSAVFDNVKTDFTAGELLWMGMQAAQIDNKNIQFFTLPGYGQMSTAGTSLPLSFFFPYEKETLELVNKYFNPFKEPITELDIVSGPEGGYAAVSPSDRNNSGSGSNSLYTSGSSGGGSSYYGSDDDYVWGDTTTSSSVSVSGVSGSSDDDSSSNDDSSSDDDSSSGEGGYDYNPEYYDDPEGGSSDGYSDDDNYNGDDDYSDDDGHNNGDDGYNNDDDGYNNDDDGYNNDDDSYNNDDDYSEDGGYDDNYDGYEDDGGSSDDGGGGDGNDDGYEETGGEEGYSDDGGGESYEDPEA